MIKDFNDCAARGVRCPGHKNSWLEGDYSKPEEKELMLKILDNYYPPEKEEKTKK